MERCGLRCCPSRKACKFLCLSLAQMCAVCHSRLVLILPKSLTELCVCVMALRMLRKVSDSVRGMVRERLLVWARTGAGYFGTTGANIKSGGLEPTRLDVDICFRPVSDSVRLTGTGRGCPEGPGWPGPAWRWPSAGGSGTWWLPAGSWPCRRS